MTHLQLAVTVGYAEVAHTTTVNVGDLGYGEESWATLNGEDKECILLEHVDVRLTYIEDKKGGYLMLRLSVDKVVLLEEPIDLGVYEADLSQARKESLLTDYLESWARAHMEVECYEI